MITFLKKLRNLPMLGLVVVASALSVALGCGGSPSGNAAPQNVVTIDLAGAIDTTEGESIATVGFNIINSSNASISSATYYDNTSAPIVKDFNPLVAPGRTIAVIAKVKVKETTGGTSSGGSSTTTTTFTSTTSIISVVVSATNGSSQTFNLSVSVDQATGKVTLTPGSSTIQFTGQ